MFDHLHCRAVTFAALLFLILFPGCRGNEQLDLPVEQVYYLFLTGYEMTLNDDGNIVEYKIGGDLVDPPVVVNVNGVPITTLNAEGAAIPISPWLIDGDNFVRTFVKTENEEEPISKDDGSDAFKPTYAYIARCPADWISSGGVGVVIASKEVALDDFSVEFSISHSREAGFFETVEKDSENALKKVERLNSLVVNNQAEEFWTEVSAGIKNYVRSTGGTEDDVVRIKEGVLSGVKGDQALGKFDVTVEENGFLFTVDPTAANSVRQFVLIKTDGELVVWSIE